MSRNFTLCNQSQPNITGTNSSLCKHEQVTATGGYDWYISQEVKIFLYCIYGMIFVLGTFGNLLVFYSVGWKKKRHTSNDVFLLNLAFADLIGSIFMPIVMVSDMVSNFQEWYYGKLGCSILPSITPITMAASSWTLVGIAADRYRIIKSPLKAKPSVGVLSVVLILVWSVAIGSSLVYSMALTLVDGLCWDFYHSPQEKRDANLAFCIVNWPIPMIIMVIFYFLSAKELKKSMAVHANNAAITQRLRQNQKIIRMFTIVVCLFFFLTTPYTTFLTYFHIMVYYYPEKIHMPTILSANYTLTCITTMNSCVNPLIYARLQAEVRDQLVWLFNSLCKCCRQPQGGLKTASSQAYIIGNSTSSLPMTSSSVDTKTLRN